MFSIHDEIELIIGYLNEGVNGYLSKNSTISTLKSRIFNKLNIQSVVSLTKVFNLHN